MKKRWPYIALPILGILFCLWYVKAAAYDIVYTDYIRLVNSYLPDVFNPDKFFVPDVLTRIPINYLERIINVLFFHYSTTFDMVLGVLGLGGAGLILAAYCFRYSVRVRWLIPLLILLFGLNKWEMLTNGTGWVHFLAMACFYYHYLVLDRIWYGTEKHHDRLKLMVLPFIITLGIAGPYCGVYSVVMILSYIFCMAVKKRRTGKADTRYLLYMVCVLIPLLLYLWSNSYAVEDHAGMQNLPFVATFLETPSYFLHFLLKSFAGDMFGGEMIEGWIGLQTVSDRTVYVIGALVLCGLLLAVWMNFRFHLYKTTILPLMFLVTGGLNHILILVSRWGFMNENYGMSSRYALQFQFVTLGIVLTVALAWEQVRRQWVGLIAGSCCVAVLCGSMVTTAREIRQAPSREAYGQNIATVALQYRTVSDDVLRNTFDYRRSREDSGEKVRNALTILEEHGFNIFGRQ